MISGHASERNSSEGVWINSHRSSEGGPVKIKTRILPSHTGDQPSPGPQRQVHCSGVAPHPAAARLPRRVAESKLPSGGARLDAAGRAKRLGWQGGQGVQDSFFRPLEGQGLM